MATRTIASPGIQINEVDLSIIARPTAETNVFMTGFAPQGPTDEIVNVGSISEFESIFGTPENAAERYLYHSAKQVLNGSGNLLVTRVPYGSGAGAGFANSYSALVYPVSSNSSNYENSTAFNILEPYSILLTSDQYQTTVEGGISWNTSLSGSSAINSFGDIGKGVKTFGTNKAFSLPNKGHIQYGRVCPTETIFQGSAGLTNYIHLYLTVFLIGRGSYFLVIQSFVKSVIY